MAEPEDSKPKLNLIINHAGTRAFPSPSMRASFEGESSRFLAEVTVKVKANMQFKKIFEVAEVSAHSPST